MDETLRSFRPDLYAGKRILVSGASSAIGLAIAQGFTRLGGPLPGVACRSLHHRRRSAGDGGYVTG